MVFHKKLVFAVIIFVCWANAFALTIPEKPSNYINDYANLISKNTVGELNQQLKLFEDTSGQQIAVAIFPSLEGEALEDFTMRLAEKWQIGTKSKDDGVLLVIFSKDHKIRIEVGYGLENRLTDAVAGMIIRNIMAPEFKIGAYDQGIINSINTIKGYILNPSVNQPTNNNELPWYVIALLILFFVVFIIGLIKGKPVKTSRGS